MSSISRVGSSFLASSHMAWTQACELRLASRAFEAFFGSSSTAVPAELTARAEIAELSWPRDRLLGLVGWMRSTNSTWPPKPQVSLKVQGEDGRMIEIALDCLPHHRLKA